MAIKKPGDCSPGDIFLQTKKLHSFIRRAVT